MVVAYPYLDELRPRHTARIENFSFLFFLICGLAVNYLGRVIDTSSPLAFTLSDLLFSFRTAKEMGGLV